MLSKKFFKESFFLLFIIGFLNLIALKYDLYWLVDEFDSLMHFLGGAWVALSFISLYHFSGLFAPRKNTFWKFLKIAFPSTFLVSVVWEIYELASGTTMATWADYPYDTTLDFVMDGLGAVAASMYAFAKEVTNEKKKESKEEKNG